VSYLLKTTSPYFHSFHYGGEPGAAAKQLEDDMRNTVEHYEYSNLKIREVRACCATSGLDANVCLLCLHVHVMCRLHYYTCTLSPAAMFRVTQSVTCLLV
jgi:hypothetical protein